MAAYINGEPARLAEVNKQDAASSPERNGDYASSSSSTIKVNRIHTRTSRTLLLQSALRLARPFLLKSEPQPVGSPVLEPHPSVLKQCNVRERTVKNIKIYDVNARSDSTKVIFGTKDGSGWVPGEAQARQLAKVGSKDPLNLNQSTIHTGQEIKSRDWAHAYGKNRARRPRHIYYFCGGGWRMKPAKEHWKLCAHLALELTKRGTPTTVSIVSYPLAPHCPASFTMPMLSKLYYDLVPHDPPEIPNSPTPGLERRWSSATQQREKDPPEVIFAGDSSGGNIALALTLHVLTNDPLANPPSSIFLISPNVEMELNHPDLPKLARKDPFLTVSALKKFHADWCGTDTPTSDPRVSPMRGDLSVLQRHDINVNGILGMYDILSLDAQEMVKKLADAKVQGRWLYWDKQIHSFPLTAFHDSQEGKDSLSWMLNTLEGRSFTN